MGREHPFMLQSPYHNSRPYADGCGELMNGLIRELPSTKEAPSAAGGMRVRGPTSRLQIMVL